MVSSATINNNNQYALSPNWRSGVVLSATQPFMPHSNPARWILNVVISVRQLRKRMLKEVKYLAQCYKAVKLKFKSNNLTPGLQMVENPPAAQETGFQPLGGEDPLE